MNMWVSIQAWHERVQMKKLLVLSMILPAVLGFVFPVHAQEVKVVFATGSAEGAYHLLGASMAKIWNSRIPGMNVTARTTGNPAENIKMVNKKEAELALVQSDILDQAFSGKEAFKEKLTNMKAVAVLCPDIDKPAANTVLIANSDTKDDFVYKLAKALFENKAELSAASVACKELDVQKAVAGVSIPFHPGAAKFYKEAGVKMPEAKQADKPKKHDPFLDDED